MITFLSNLPPRELYQFDHKSGKWVAWRFDGFNQIGEKFYGYTKDEALSKLRSQK